MALQDTQLCAYVCRAGYAQLRQALQDAAAICMNVKLLASVLFVQVRLNAGLPAGHPRVQLGLDLSRLCMPDEGLNMRLQEQLLLNHQLHQPSAFANCVCTAGGHRVAKATWQSCS